jgi:hypothetical protein
MNQVRELIFGSEIPPRSQVLSLLPSSHKLPSGSNGRSADFEILLYSGATQFRGGVGYTWTSYSFIQIGCLQPISEFGIRKFFHVNLLFYLKTPLKYFGIPNSEFRNISMFKF